MSLRTLLTTLLLTASFSVTAATEIVPLNNRTSADLLPVAQNFLGKEGRVSAYGNQLIVNAEPEKIEELRAFIAQLDIAAKRLLITVDTNENNTRTIRVIRSTARHKPASSPAALSAAMAAYSRSRPAKAYRP